MIEDEAQRQHYARALHERQQHVDAVVHSESRKKLVVAGPGTGKTFLFKKVLRGKDETLTLTFVNALVEDLSRDLFGLSDVKTLHGFARAQLQKATSQSISIYPRLSTVIQQDAGILLGVSVDFDPIFHNRNDGEQHLDFYRTRRRYYGHFGFSDIVYAAVLNFEKHPDRIPTYDQIVVDEFQDFNALEVSLIDLLATRSPILLAGDDDQALYESLKSANPKHIRERHSDTEFSFTRFALPFCSRSTRVIIDSANDIIAGAQQAGLLVGRIDKPFRYFPCTKKDKESDGHPCLIYSSVFPKQVPWFIQKQITEITRAVRDEYTVLILSPTRNQCRKTYEAMKAKGFKNVHFAERAEGNEPCLLDGLQLLLLDKDCNLGWRIVSKALMPQTAFEALLLQAHNEGDDSKMVESVDEDMKKQVRRLLTALRGVRDGKDVEGGQLSEVFGHLGIDSHGQAAQLLRDELADTGQRLAEPGIRRTPIEVTTFQSSKGLAADYVFITHFDDKYCTRDSDAGISDQDVCSFLVAMTRARRGVYLLSTDRKRKPTFLSWIDKRRICEIKSPGGDDEQ
jgi:superfamily I DNA/RNA helicase